MSNPKFNVDSSNLRLQRDIRHAVAKMQHRLLPDAAVLQVVKYGLDNGTFFLLLGLADESELLLVAEPGVPVVLRKLER